MSDLTKPDYNEAYHPTTPKLRRRKHTSVNPVIAGDRRNLPPLIQPVMFPDQIMATHLEAMEIKTIAALLQKYQRSGIGWDEWSLKHWPQEISERWTAVVAECRTNGFTHPRGQGEKIVWHQILGQPRELPYVDQCTSCRMHADECAGRFDERDQFVPCWRVRRAA